MRGVVFVLLVALSAACGGGVRATGVVGERALQLDGTGAAWIDQTLYLRSSGALQLQEHEPSRVALHLLFSGAVFDPRSSFDDLGASGRADVEAQMAAADRLEVIVRRGDRLAAGDVLDFDSDDGDFPQAAPFVNRVFLDVGADPADGSAEYPEEIPVVGSRRTGSLELTQVEPSLAGVLRVDFGPTTQEEPLGVVEGEVEIGFNIELTTERVAECNFARSAQGEVDPCDISAPAPLP